ncbi:major capsid protein [Salmon gill poxvirus]|uniref:62 kDa protein n=1 Tax=Salmon gill poxvirus TaxID=1680908 RepID=A0A0H4Y1C6_9POXV|nr:major capsid protein [Salmon gill poxvirus]AKR04222.1 major capsid protein [Salmon gill poxvirus]
MNSVLIQSAKQLEQNNEYESTDMFGCPIITGTSYMPCLIHVESNGVEYMKATKQSEHPTTVYSFNINDKEINAFNKFILSFEVSELHSNHPIAYVPYFGFKLIKKVAIYDENNKVIEIDGATLFSRALSKKDNISTSGYSKELNNFNINYTENLNNEKTYFLPSTQINVPLNIFYPNQDTFSTIKNFPNSFLRIEVTVMTELTNVMVYNPEATIFLAYEKPLVNTLSIKKPVLGIVVYSVQNRESTNDEQYIINNYESVGNYEDDEHYVHGIDNVSHINFDVGNDLSGKRFMVWAGHDQSESNWTNMYLKKLLTECIIILPNGESPDVNDGNLSPKAKYQIMKNNKIELGNIKTIDLVIERVPKNYSAWFHTNPLVFRENKTQSTYNIVEKINFVHCSWNILQNNFVFYEIDHQITIGDISVPIEIWNVNTKSDEGDNRSVLCKNSDVIINDPFFRGVDFLNKQRPIEIATVKHGNETLYQSHLNACYYYPDNFSRISFPFMTKGYGNISFCHHTDTAVCPNYLPSDHIRGRCQIGIKAVWANQDKSTPHYHISKKLIIQYGVVSKVSSVNKRNITSILNSRTIIDEE